CLTAAFVLAAIMFARTASAEPLATTLQTVDEVREQMRTGRGPSQPASIPDWAQARINELEESAANRKGARSALLAVGGLAAVVAVVGMLKFRSECVAEPKCSGDGVPALILAGAAGGVSLTTILVGASLYTSGAQRAEEARRMRLSFAPTSAGRGL